MPRVSILLPARGRPAGLKSSINSIFDLAAKPDEVEVLVRLDGDDPHLAAEQVFLRSSPTRDISIGIGKRIGYAHMHTMYNWCAYHSKGQWLVNWNDDMTMITEGWDALLCDAPSYCVQFPRRDTTPTSDCTVPITNRSIYEVLGHLSLNAYCDAWISDFSAFAGTSVIRDDIVFHHDRLNDQTLRDQGVVGTAAWGLFTTQEQKTARRRDMDKIMAAPPYAKRFDGWRTETVFHQIDHLQLAAGEAKARAYALKGRTS